MRLPSIGAIVGVPFGVLLGAEDDLDGYVSTTAPPTPPPTTPEEWERYERERAARA